MHGLYSLIPLLLAATVSLADAAPQKRAAPQQNGCADVMLVLPVLKEQLLHNGATVDLDMVNAQGGRALSWMPMPRDVAMCNTLAKATKEQLAGQYQRYDPEQFYFGTNQTPVVTVGLHTTRGVMAKVSVVRGQDGEAVARFKLPVGKPVFIGFSVCDSRDWSWRYYAAVWKRGALIVRFGEPIESEANAYRTDGKCDRYSKGWLGAERVPLRAHFLHFARRKTT